MELKCEMCPNGCAMTIKIEDDEMIVTGEGCMKGAAFARDKMRELEQENDKTDC